MNNRALTIITLLYLAIGLILGVALIQHSAWYFGQFEERADTPTGLLISLALECGIAVSIAAKIALLRRGEEVPKVISRVTWLLVGMSFVGQFVHADAYNHLDDHGIGHYLSSAAASIPLTALLLAYSDIFTALVFQAPPHGDSLNQSVGRLAVPACEGVTNSARPQVRRNTRAERGSVTSLPVNQVPIRADTPADSAVYHPLTNSPTDTLTDSPTDSTVNHAPTASLTNSLVQTQTDTLTNSVVYHPLTDSPTDSAVYQRPTDTLSEPSLGQVRTTADSPTDSTLYHPLTDSPTASLTNSPSDSPLADTLTESAAYQRLTNSPTESLTDSPADSPLPDTLTDSAVYQRPTVSLTDSPTDSAVYQAVHHLSTQVGDQAMPILPRTVSELVAASGINKSQVTRRLNMLVASGQAEKLAGYPARYIVHNTLLMKGA